jgi:hypothetical protein
MFMKVYKLTKLNYLTKFHVISVIQDSKLQDLG